MPYEIASAQQSVMTSYAEWPGASKHPDKVLLVTCYKGDKLSGLGHVMGPPGRSSKGNLVFVSGQFWTSSDGSCYAITAKYDGPKEACWETYIGACFTGRGETFTALGFKGVGEFTEISASQLRTFVKYARATEYQVAK